MTFRVYLRLPNQLVSDKTTTDSRAVAETAFQELVDRPPERRVGAVGVAFTENGRQLKYHEFGDGPATR